MSVDSKRTALAPWVRSGAMQGLVSLLDSLGFDPVKVVGKDGMRIAEAEDPYRKVDLNTIYRAFQKAAVITKKSDLLMELGLEQKLEDWGPFGFLFLNAPTVGEALKDLCRYSVALQSHARFQWIEQHDQFSIQYSSNHPELSGWELDAEATVTFIMSIVNDMLKASITPKAISFEHQSVSKLSTYQRLLGTKPNFGTTATRLTYSSKLARRSIPNANPKLYQVLKRHLRELAETESEEEQLINFVRNNISRGLAQNTATLEHIAAEIALEPRTLQRRLKEEGSSFQTLVDEVRLARAKYFLTKTRLSITDIALELGYAEASVFVRAFKRMTACTPSQYRRDKT